MVKISIKKEEKTIKPRQKQKQKQSQKVTVNIGSDEMVTINQLVRYVTDISGKEVYVKHIDGPTGVRGRNSDNKLINEKLGWQPTQPLYDGLIKTYEWINKQPK
jgi:nucleoside-diphosphate-sugar epimerase